MNTAILALDLARVAGAAWECDSGYQTRAFALGARGKVDDHLVELDRIVTDLVAESGAGIVSIEFDTGRGRGSVTLRAYHAVAAKAARQAGCTVIRNINSSSARKLALGHGGGTKEEAARTAAALYCLPPGISDDEVDAVILLEATKAHLRAEEIRRAAAKAGVVRKRKPTVKIRAHWDQSVSSTVGVGDRQ